ncbi:MAG TPA: helix-turn-helix domain-containing protein [Frankiaceae bacterium]|nr:helix-turn-helix domain-containing protein [Frankiaceae bacterium]
MKSPGWQGQPPRNDTEARQRVIAAAMRCMDRQEPHKVALSDVAAELGVTRQTVYRLFPSTEELLFAVAAAAADAFVDRLVARVRKLTDPAAMLVECLAFTLERMPKERYLSLLFVPDHKPTFTRRITSSVGIELTEALLSRLPVDWPALGIDASDRAELIEIYLRTLQSFAVDPNPARTRRERRSLLQHWLAPAVHSYQRRS